MEHRTDKGSRETLSLGRCSLIPRPSMPPVFDHLQYAKTEEEGRLLRGGVTTFDSCAADHVMKFPRKVTVALTKHCK